ncbi:MAG: isochorismatase [Chroococcales cyanobacterium]
MENQYLKPFPIPPFFEPAKLREVWRVSYQDRAKQAEEWAEKYKIQPASEDKKQVGLLLIDVQNTFCLPDFELFVAGRTGTGAIDDNQRLCEFIYSHLGLFSKIIATMDTHVAMQVFHPIFWINEKGEHPQPSVTTIFPHDIEQGVWKVNPAIAANLPHWSYEDLQQYGYHYAHYLSEQGRYPLVIWPYHGKLGGIGHALVSGVEEAIFFHTVARKSQAQYELKGNNPLTENYSVLQPEVLSDHRGNSIASKNTALIEQLLEFDALIIAGQAKSHCVAWTVDDLRAEIEARNPKLAQKVYLLEDCTSPVVVPGMVDYTQKADEAFLRFADAGMNVVRSSDPIEAWLKI